MSRCEEIVGGVGGLEVEYSDLGAAATVLQSAALDIVGAAIDARRISSNVGLLASSFLDPGGFARVEAAVLAAVLGPHGLLAAAARLEERSLCLRAAVLRYVASDRLGVAALEVRHWAEGTAFAAAMPILLPLAVLTPAGPVAAHWLNGGGAAPFLADHPGVAEEVAGAAPAFFGLPLSLTGRLPTIEQESSLLALLYPAGSPHVVGRGTDTGAPPAPSGVGDLLLGLQYRDQQAQGDAQGEIDVRRLRRVGPDGTVVTSWVVDLPGTKDWQADPRHREHLNDLATNLATIAGDHSARIDGLTRALELAGVGKDEPVMLVGHSQGGLVALRAAQQYAGSGQFDVTHVVTAGSPIARMSVPASVTVLALENRNDIVPQLDGRPSPDEANRITILLDTQTHDVGANHAISTTYLLAAQALDGDSDDPSLIAWRESAAPFLTEPGQYTAVRTTVWDIRNGG